MSSYDHYDHHTQTAAVTIRRLSERDHEQVHRLAEVDSSLGALQAPILGAEVDGRLMAAISVPTGDVVADPFTRTAEVRSLLQLRRTQLRRRDEGRERRGLGTAFPRTRGTLAGSPPGAGGRLLTLLPRF
jgi:hypothetical protein